MPQIFDVRANEKARYKRNELEYAFPFPFSVNIAIHMIELKKKNTY